MITSAALTRRTKAITAFIVFDDGLLAVGMPELVARADFRDLHRRKHMRSRGRGPPPRRDGAMRAEGLEPTRSCEHRDLNPACLPSSSTPAG